MDDITFCLSDCQRTDCYRHPSNIQDRTIPHSYADFKGTETCPEKMQLSKEDATKGTTFDCIRRQAVINEMKDMYTAAEKWGQDAKDDEIKARAESCMATNVELKLRIEKLPSVQSEQQELITWLLDEIWDDDTWTLNCDAFPEILCRKLVKLGYVAVEGEKYVRVDKPESGN